MIDGRVFALRGTHLFVEGVHRGGEVLVGAGEHEHVAVLTDGVAIRRLLWSVRQGVGVALHVGGDQTDLLRHAAQGHDRRVAIALHVGRTELDAVVATREHGRHTVREAATDHHGDTFEQVGQELLVFERAREVLFVLALLAVGLEVRAVAHALALTHQPHQVADLDEHVAFPIAVLGARGRLLCGQTRAEHQDVGVKAVLALLVGVVLVTAVQADDLLGRTVHIQDCVRGDHLGVQIAQALGHHHAVVLEELRHRFANVPAFLGCGLDVSAHILGEPAAGF